MTGTMLDYLREYGRYSLDEIPFNDVDSLVLCQLAYLKYDGLVCDVREDGSSVSMQELADHEDFDRMFTDVRFEMPNRALFQEAYSSRRFHNMTLNYHINLVRKARETQFSAVTFFMEDETVYIAFRGTDETIVGWKEDFNMAYLSPVPAQEYSVKYLNDVAKRLQDRRFYIGGHSKGGNLAVYSAMNCAQPVQERILKIYNMDGPGFRPEILEKCDYQKIKDRVVKIIPQSSLVGMLLELGENFRFVESNRLGLAQHDPYTWLVSGKEFAWADGLYEGRRFWDNTINEWILSLEEQELKTFVDTFYQVVTASGAEDLIAFASDWRNNLKKVWAALKEVDRETASVMKSIVRSFFTIGKINIQSELERAVNSAAGKDQEDDPRR